MKAKALLICPGRRPAVTLLAESCPLAVAPLLGKCLVEYWIEYLVALGVREILITASDRPSQVLAVVGDGTRWGLPISVTAENHELSTVQATEKHGTHSDAMPEVVVLMDHLPGRPGLHLFESYAAWFAGLQAWLPRAQALERIGQCEVKPGVWVGLRARIDPAAQLLAPCWLGDYVCVNSGAVIGPGAILEDGVIVAAGAHVVQSVIGPATFVGTQTRVENSIADRHTLVNWTTNSYLRVPDAFWLSSLKEPLTTIRPEIWPGPMKIKNDGYKLSITQLGELSAANSIQFRKEVHAAFSSSLSVIEVDLSRTRFVDSCGLATLCGLHRSIGTRGISLRLLNPEPAIRQLLELTQMHRFFEIDRSEPAWPGLPKPAITRVAPAAGMIPAH
ncbi:MAG TPA: STAS domain-containing protein [Opitutaceae bacterium]|jgi:anti-sigma B factor antagonist|nr:STAS domain-containing protein [Opitutaceae bacterium]